MIKNIVLMTPVMTSIFFANIGGASPVDSVKGTYNIKADTLEVKSPGLPSGFYDVQFPFNRFIIHSVNLSAGKATVSLVNVAKDGSVSPYERNIKYDKREFRVASSSDDEAVIVLNDGFSGEEFLIYLGIDNSGDELPNQSTTELVVRGDILINRAPNVTPDAVILRAVFAK